MELLLKLTPAITSALFSIGGTGHKWVRRYMLPIWLLIILYICKVNLTQAVIAIAIIGVGLSLPYGDSLPLRFRYLIRGLVISTWFLPMLLVSTSPVTIAMSIGSTLLLTVMFWVSNQKWGEKWLSWYIWEPIAGGLIALNLIIAR